MDGEVETPAADHLFDIRDNADKLDNDTSELFHSLVAKLLFLSKRARPRYTASGGLPHHKSCRCNYR